MNKYLILGIALLVILLGVGFWFFGAFTTSPSTTATSTPVGLPSSGFVPGSTSVSGSDATSSPATAGGPTLSLPARGTGQIIVANDFLHNGTTIADPENKGNYFLAGSVGYCLPDGTCPEGFHSDSFVVTYDSSQQFFNIVLTQEPLSTARTATENFLLSTLGISKGNLCNLRYYIGTVNAVNETYAGENLGFSFCPGAVKLPN